ncbi:DUF1801 domain-containing protein [Arenicella xantha]|uniref:Uncharacterized protein DUF1801 n=1 Tax=Arenicella xantha TaxID=644221 RepID=A0A395JSA9_9GAMM|nr:DUF1801 domain-containing protein [Arenicella xantha]RBP53346.1 uncharacterized protein DUF1801 [Arenicella xantha]
MKANNLPMPTSVQQAFDAYPTEIRTVMQCLRELIFDVAKQWQLGPVNESLKWGEPSYTVTGGSPVRIDWKAKQPDQVGLYFHCQTSLVETFRELYKESLSFSANRSIVVPYQSTDTLNDLPLAELEHCVLLAFKYHKLKHLPLLGE